MKKAIKIFFLSILIIIFVLIFGRILISSDKTVFNDFYVSRATADAYDADKTLNVNSLSRKSGRSERGYFMAYSFYTVPDTGEVQAALRYNVSAYGYTDTDENESFSFRLYDKTNDKYYDSVAFEKKSRYGIYRYARFIFEGVNMDESAELYLVMENSKEECDKQCMHYENQPYEDYKLKGRDIKEIERMLAE